LDCFARPRFFFNPGASSGSKLKQQRIMALKYGLAVRNARLDSIEATVGTAPKLQIRSGAPPTNPGDADSGTLLCEITLPSDWMDTASAGAKAKLGTWSGTGVAAGTAGHFRVKNSAGSITHLQGDITATGGGGDMTLNNTSIAVDQEVTINAFTITAGNA
jgi:hypothetical protein